MFQAPKAIYFAFLRKYNEAVKNLREGSNMAKFLKNNWFFFTMIIGIVAGCLVGYF